MPFAASGWSGPGAKGKFWMNLKNNYNLFIGSIGTRHLHPSIHSFIHSLGLFHGKVFDFSRVLHFFIGLLIGLNYLNIEKYTHLPLVFYTTLIEMCLVEENSLLIVRRYLVSGLFSPSSLFRLWNVVVLFVYSVSSYWNQMRLTNGNI